MNEQTKPSPGALRAAVRLDTEGFVFSWKTNQAAEIIDRETGVAELLEAAKLTVLHFKRSLDSGNFMGDDEHEAWTTLDKAIAKAEAK